MSSSLGAPAYDSTWISAMDTGNFLYLPNIGRDNWGVSTDANNVTMYWDGRIQFPVDGTYAISANVDDNAWVWIDVNEDGKQGGGEIGSRGCCGWSVILNVTVKANVKYRSGFAFSEGGGGNYVQFYWSGPVPQEIIPASALFFDPRDL